MDGRIRENYIFNVLNQVLSLVVPFISAPYLSRVLGADGIGSYSYHESIVAYFVLIAAFGLSLYGQREISYCQNDRAIRSKVFWETFLIGFFSGLVAIILYLVFLLNGRSDAMFLVLSLNLIACPLDISWFFTGMENFKLVSIRSLLFKVINVAFIFLVVKDKTDLVVYAAGISGLSLLNGISLWFSLPKYVSFVQLKDLHPCRRIPAVFSLFVPTIAIQVYTVLDKTMIGMITKDSFQNGYYEQAVRMTRMVLSLITALGYVMMSRIGAFFSSKKDAELKQTIYESYRFVWFLAIPLSFGLSSISSNFIPWFYGPGFEGTIPLLRILSFLIIAIGVSNVTGIQYMIPVGKQRQYTASVITGACTNLILNAFLIPSYKALGASIASLIAEISVTATQLFLIRKDLSVGRILRSSWKYLVSGSVMFFVVSLEGKLFDATIKHTIAMIVSGCVVYFFMLFVVRDDIVRTILSKGDSSV